MVVKQRWAKIRAPTGKLAASLKQKVDFHFAPAEAQTHSGENPSVSESTLLTTRAERLVDKLIIMIIDKL